MPLPWTELVHERLAVIAMFAYSQPPLIKVRTERFDRVSRWRFLEKVIFDIPERSATQALFELALYFRSLDDEEALTPVWQLIDGAPTVGTLHLEEGKTQPLTPREMSNKIIHAERIEWKCETDDPEVISFGRNQERWIRAEVKIIHLLALGARLMS